MQKVTGMCPYCSHKLKIKQLSCPNCKIVIEGDIPLSNLSYLTTEQQRFIELFVLSSGNLKEMSEMMKISYPTLRSRLDSIMEVLSGRTVGSKSERKNILDEMEEGKISPKEAAKLIKSLRNQ